MAIRGIDTQVMAHRVTDYVKDASAVLRRNDTNQDFLAYQNRIASALAQEQVASLQQKEAPRTRVDEKQQQDISDKKKKKKRQENRADLGEFIVDTFEPDNPTVGTSVPRRLDIEV